MKRGKSYLREFIWIVPPLFLAGCSYLFPSKEDKRFTPKDLNLPEIKYHAEMEILGDKSEESYFKSVPELMHSDASAPTSTNALRYRAEADLKLLRKALKNRGYFNGKVEYVLDYSQEEKYIKFIVTPGELYHIEGVDIEMTGADDIPIMPEKARKVINITNGEQVRLDKVINSVILLNRYFVTHGYPDAKVEEPVGRINDAKKTVLLIYKIDLNGKKRYGKLTIAGNQSVSTCYIKNRLPIKQGEFYDQQELDNARRSLLDSEIFSTVIITHESQGDRANLKVDVKEAPPRRVAAGLRYGTQEGIGGKLLWQHKNVFGNGEDFYIRGEGGQRQMKASIGLRIPDVIWRDFTLSTTASLTKANTKAYDGYVYNYYVGLEHKVDAYSTYSVGAEAELSDLKKFRRVKRYFGGLPMSYIYDASNDRINPYKGWRLRLDFAPYLGDFVQNRPMFRLHLMSSQYWRLVKKDKFVIATWERIGQIEGVPFTDIPLNRLWYGGGSGSVRGYAFQKLSKPDPNGSPMGGKSIIEFGIEPRWRVTETIGLSLFWEAGAVSEKRIAGLKSQEYRSGYGIGAKYYTDIGPLRIDLAFPSKRRKVNGKSYDSAVQFYISLGQAF